jgi:hypothetical protein
MEMQEVSAIKNQVTAVETITLLFMKGPLPDGDLRSLQVRDNLLSMGFIDRSLGWNWLTSEGIEFALNCLHLGPDKEMRSEQ